jgi:hypothetical protein
MMDNQLRCALLCRLNIILCRLNIMAAMEVGSYHLLALQVAGLVTPPPW